MHCTLNLTLTRHNMALLTAGENSISQTDLAEAVGVNPSTINKLCRNNAKSISFKLLDALCQYFDCETGDILARSTGIAADLAEADSGPELDKEARAAKAAQERLARAAKG